MRSIARGLSPGRVAVALSMAMALGPALPGCRRAVVEGGAASAPEAPPARDQAASVDALDDARGRGKEIYTRGTSPSGVAISARLGQSRDPVPGALVACANCHGRDGRGRSEGGLDPPDLHWRATGRPRAADARRARPAYTPALLGRATTMGLDSAGAALGAGMPRYQLAARDLADLVAYLQVLGTEPDPGVGPDAIRLGSLLPPAGEAPALREAIARTLDAYAADVNGRGGLYRRRVEFVHETLSPDPDRAGPELAASLREGRVFALVAPFIAGREEAVLRAARDAGVPVIGPFAARGPAPADGWAFYTQPGPSTQARALAEACAGRSPGGRVAVVVDDDPASEEAAGLVDDGLARRGAPPPERVVLRPGAGEADLDGLARRGASGRIGSVVFLGPSALARPLIDAADRASWRPDFYLPSALWDRSPRDVPASFDGRVFLAFPYLSSDVTRPGREFLDRLHDARGLPREHEATQVAVMAALKVLEEGLRRSGRDASRARLVEELERLEGFETGFSRPLSFGPNRRVGSPGAYLLALEDSGRRFRKVGWTAVGTTP